MLIKCSTVQDKRKFESKRKATQHIQKNVHTATSNFLTEALQVRRQKDHLFKALKEKTSYQEYYAQKNKSF